MGGNHPQFFLYLFTYIQSLYKFLDRRFRNGLIGTGQRFQRFIRMRIGLAAQNGLDSLGHHAPAIVQVTVDGSVRSTATYANPSKNFVWQ